MSKFTSSVSISPATSASTSEAIFELKLFNNNLNNEEQITVFQGLQRNQQNDEQLSEQ